MVISFLQRHPKIAAGHIRAEDNLGALLLEILELYGTRFNFENVGIAIDNGGSYFHKGDFEYLDSKIWKKICIRDPNDPLNNISKASFQIENIIKVFSDAYKNLSTRCYLVHAKIQEGKQPPWGTNCGSLLDSIIERPSVALRERLQRAWKPSMSDGFELDGAVPEDLVPLPLKLSKSARRAADMLANKDAREKDRQNNTERNVQQRKPAPPPRPPKKKKQKKAASDKPPRSPSKTRPPPANNSLGTKDTPILLDSPSSSPRPASRRTQPSQSKRKRKNASVGDVAAANLTGSGSISGIPRSTITID